MPIHDTLLGSLQQVVRRFAPDSTLHHVWELTGGISSQTLAIAFTRPDGTHQKLVLKQHGIADRTRNPHIASDEFRLLQTLHAAGLPVPEPYFVDTTCEQIPLPYILLEFIERDRSLSQTTPQNLIDSFARTLASIHALDLKQHDLSFLPHQKTIIQSHLDTTLSSNDPVLNALRQAFPHIKMHNRALLHGDFWTGNILWHNHQLAGVIDWEDAMLGDPLGDLGKSRLEMLWAFGMPFMNAYTTVYQVNMPGVNLTDLPFWDLWGAYRLADFAHWIDDPVKVKEMKEKYTRFINDAINRLSN